MRISLQAVVSPQTRMTFLANKLDTGPFFLGRQLLCFGYTMLLVASRIVQPKESSLFHAVIINFPAKPRSFLEQMILAPVTTPPHLIVSVNNVEMTLGKL